MELKDFISTTIEQISLGIQEAQKECNRYGALVNPRVGEGSSGDYYVEHRNNVEKRRWRIQTLDLDIAVTVTKSTEMGGEGKIGISCLGAGVNVQGGKSTANESRIRFSIPICLPVR